MRRSAHPPGPAAPYARTLGAIVTFLLLGLFVKYAETRLTLELRDQAGPWMSFRFSWQELALASALFGLVFVWQRLVPQPGRATRVSLGLVRLILIFGIVLGVLGIKYYALYHGHMTTTDFEHLGWAVRIAATANIFESPAIRAGAVLGPLFIFGVPWLCARLSPAAVRRTAVTATVVVGVLAATAWAAGRPRLSEARLAPAPLLWFFYGPYATYLNLPPIEQLAPIGERHRTYQPSGRARNVILVVFESVPARALTAYDPAALAGERLFTEFADDTTVFEQVFAVAPNSDGSLMSVLGGEAPVPDHAAALEARAEPTFAETLKAHGYQTHFLLNAPTNAFIDRLVSRGFDRALHMDSPWPNKEKFVRHSWGYDDRMLFADARAFLEAQTPDSPPFLLVLYTNNGHYPYPAAQIPGVEDHPDARVRHGRLVNHITGLLAELYGSMKASGMAAQTALVAYGDHGQAFGEHAGNWVHSKELYLENMHVPMWLMHPGRFGLPRRIGQLGSVDDIMPTVLDLLGIAAPPTSGMSLLFEAPDRMLFMMTPFGPGVVGFRNRQYFYALSRTGRELLFDWKADPREMHNLLEQRPEIAAGFRDRLKGVMRPGG